jgi:hypothetical protein
MPAADEEFWNVKPPPQWNAREIYQLLNHSPWAQTVQAWRPGAPSDLHPANLPTPPQDWGPKGVVTWESAQPIRQALKKPLRPVFSDCYVIGVDGIPLDGVSPGTLMSSSVLRSPGKAKWEVKPVVVRVLVRTSLVYLIGFAKDSTPIRPDTGDIAFQARFAQWTVDATFKPRNMLYHGQLAL